MSRLDTYRRRMTCNLSLKLIELRQSGVPGLIEIYALIHINAYAEFRKSYLVRDEKQGPNLIG